MLFNVHNSEDALLRPHAARLDGASDWRIFHRVVLPMSRNSIAALAIFTFLWNWEDYLWPFLMITDETSSCCRWASRCSPASTAPITADCSPPPP